MGRKKSKSNAFRATFVIVLLLLAVGSVMAFKTDLFGLQANGQSKYSKELLSIVSVKGTVRIDDLHLSKKEILKINRAALKHRSVFPEVNVSLNMSDKYAPIEIEKESKLKLDMVLKSDEGGEVKCWSRTVTRAGLVTLMVQSMNKAAIEFVHYRDSPDRSKKLKRLYI